MDLLTKLQNHYNECLTCMKASSTETMCEKMLLFKEHPKKEDIVLDYTEHQSVCPPCKIAHSSEMYCKPMRTYVDSGIATYQREITYEPEELTALAEQHYLNNQGAETNKYEKLARLLSLEGLSERQQQCLYLTFWERLTIRKIAQKLDLSHTTVQEHIEAGKKILKERYEKNEQLLFDDDGKKVDIVSLFNYAVANFVHLRHQITAKSDELELAV